MGVARLPTISFTENEMEDLSLNYYNMQEVGYRIHTLRKEAGYTQEQLAELLGMERSFLSRIETGKKSCSIDTLACLADLLSVSLDYLVLGKRQGTTKIRNDIEHIIAELTVITREL